MTLLIVLLVIVAAYETLVRYQMRKPVGVAYSGTIRRVVNLLDPRVEAISLWHTVWLVRIVNGTIAPLSTSGFEHEIGGHINNPEQWAGHPRLFPFMYMIEQLRHGTNCKKYEEQARKIAGEPLRCA